VKRLLLAGAGHAHLKALSLFRKTPLSGAHIALVSPRERQLYSAMLPGVIAGHYRRQEAEIHVARLAEMAHAEFIHGSIARIDLERRCAVLEDGREIDYDYLSLNVGSRIDRSVPGAEHALAAKPFEEFVDGLERERRIAIIGAGAAGVEIAMALRWRGAAVTLYSASASLPPKLAWRAARAMRRSGVDLRPGMAVDLIAAGPVIHAGASHQEFDRVILTTGASALPWLRESGLQCDRQGFVAVHPTLQSRSHAEVFAAGDCAALEGVPKSGVYAVRQGEALARAFTRLVEGQAPEEFHAQRHALLLVTCGAKRAIAHWGNWSAEGWWVWRWKDSIDRRWLRALS
jgi:pyridine nucleotide-disulfide oxidoreductase family protein